MTPPTVSSDALLGALRRYGTNPSGFLAFNSGNRYFTEPGIDGFVAYRSAGRTWVQFGGPVAAEPARAELLAAFLAHAKRQRLRVLGVQLLREDAELQAAHGHRANQFGTSYSMRMDAFTLRGQAFVKTRNMISRAAREGVVPSELGTDVPDDERAALDRQLDEIDTGWLRDKGRFVRELQFFVGERTGPYNRLRRLFLARRGGRVEAYISYSPVFGTHPGWLYDLTRRRPDSAKGAIEQTFAFAAERMREEGSSWLHLGLTPFVDLDQRHELDCAHPSAARAIRLLARHGQALYPSASQVAFKKKWRPQLETPEYLTFPGRLGLTDVWRLMKVANLA